ncbi:MAG: hypothetical protein KKB50_21265 [Planctomycetes bacterium]|nr:hypothetical protein [Planctomycetota bacterium]
MKSWEVLRQAADHIGVKALATKLKLSNALVYKWCQESARDDPGASGARNPLDRVRAIYQATEDPLVINWLCHEAHGFYVPNPRVEPGNAEEHLLGTTQRVVQDFGNLLADISRSIENDGFIDSAEADDIRQSWERLKSLAECFVVACERGFYGRQRPEPGGAEQ